MQDLAFLTAVYLGLIVLGLAIGYFGRMAIEKARRWFDSRAPVARLPFERAFPIIDDWATRESWYLTEPFLRRAAELEHVRLMREEPDLTLEQNLTRVAKIVKEKYPGAFNTLH